jgi:hypothetical protein
LAGAVAPKADRLGGIKGGNFNSLAIPVTIARRGRLQAVVSKFSMRKGACGMVNASEPCA